MKITPAMIAEGWEARRDALGVYLRALPLATQDQWDLFVCILLDLQRASAEAKQQECELIEEV